jgi:hypothetical protein
MTVIHNTNALASTQARTDALAIAEAAYAAIDTGAVIRAQLWFDGNVLHADGRAYDLSKYKRIRVFNQCWFDETNCKEGLAHLENYRKEWNDRAGCWKESPRHDIHSEAADAFRQFAQGYTYYSPKTPQRSRPNWRRV